MKLYPCHSLKESDRLFLIYKAYGINVDPESSALTGYSHTQTLSDFFRVTNDGGNKPRVLPLVAFRLMVMRLFFPPHPSLGGVWRTIMTFSSPSSDLY